MRTLFTTFMLPFLFSCNGDGSGKINLYTIEDDIELGQQLSKEIASDPDTYPILSETLYPEAYAHLYEIRDSILASGAVYHADDFEWELKIIHDDEVLNAFCAPGGYIYVYTGLIKFLAHEDNLAGVLGHEIAHADLRHSTQQLTQSFGITVLLAVLTGGDPGLLGEVAAGLVNLSFSRSDEREADEASVDYLCNTDYAADGTAGFFEQLEGFELPQFLSTHPSSETRVEDIIDYATSLECDLTLKPDADYQALIDALPQ
jgi:predicted Zn-dependent protease